MLSHLKMQCMPSWYGCINGKKIPKTSLEHHNTVVGDRCSFDLGTPTNSSEDMYGQLCLLKCSFPETTQLLTSEQHCAIGFLGRKGGWMGAKGNRNGF